MVALKVLNLIVTPCFILFSTAPLTDTELLFLVELVVEPDATEGLLNKVGIAPDFNLHFFLCAKLRCQSHVRFKRVLSEVLATNTRHFSSLPLHSGSLDLLLPLFAECRLSRKPIQTHFINRTVQTSKSTTLDTTPSLWIHPYYC